MYVILFTQQIMYKPMYRWLTGPQKKEIKGINLHVVYNRLSSTFRIRILTMTYFEHYPPPTF